MPYCALRTVWRVIRSMGAPRGLHIAFRFTPLILASFTPTPTGRGNYMRKPRKCIHLYNIRYIFMFGARTRVLQGILLHVSLSNYV